MEAKEYETNFRLEDHYWWFTGRRAVTASFLHRYIGKRLFLRILDAGCGTGGMLGFLEDHGKSFGVELRSEGIGFCRVRGIPRLAQADVAALPFRDGSFTLVSSFDVLYHQEVREDLALKELHRVCSAGGFLLLTDAAFPFLQSEHDESVHGARRYTERTLGTAVEKAGFQVLGASYWNCFLFLPVAFVRMAKKMIPRRHERPVSDLKDLPGILNAALTLLVRCEAALIRHVALPFGTSIILIARKPI